MWRMGFWGKFLKKDNEQENIQEEFLSTEQVVLLTENEEIKEVSEAQAEEIPAAVEETAPVAEETATEAQTDETVVEKAEAEKPEEAAKSGFWGRLFKKEKAEEAPEETPVESAEAEEAAETAETEEMVLAEEAQAEEIVAAVEETTPAAEETEPEAQTEETVVEEAEQEALPDEHSTGMFRRLKQGLAQTRMSISGKIEGLLNRSTEIDDDFYDELEDILMQADVGVETTMKLVENIRSTVHKKRIRETAQVFEVIKEEIRAILGEEKVDMEGVASRPAVILVVGVNGAGKTTSIAKMAWRFKQGGSRVLLAAADTFRAAAIDQLQIWADRIGISLVKREEGSDPGAVVFDAVQEAKKGKYDILIVDTAGRLQNKANLMQEIAKLRKIISREIEGAPHEVLLALDATTGQNALSQAKQFSEVTGVTGIILTKLDGTAKGGVVIAISSELNIPVKLIGIGEGMEDLREFSATAFADALFAMDTEGKKEETDNENID